ncbi:hypothetical protein Pve01_95410 [Planomonospora venezuelensis]|nr:hypothetical protein Pve01_95410 [Planomonospora venezuelensis]
MLERRGAERISIAMQVVQGLRVVLAAHIDPERGLRIDEGRDRAGPPRTSSNPRYAVMIAYDHRSIASPPNC